MSEEKKKSYNRVGFYRYRTGNYTSHKRGLTEDQIKYLQSLKVGDRLILYVNEGEKKYIGDPDITLCPLVTKYNEQKES